MMTTRIQRVVWAIALLVGTGSVQAQEVNWATRMFEKTSHNFGVVARGADTRYRIAVKNVYVETVHIATVQTSCGCTAAKPSQDTLVSGETAYIEIVMDTRKFEHLKQSRVTVVFDAPQPASVVIPVEVWIRTDVVLTPGAVEFGPLAKGAEETRKLSIAYAGRPDWTIRDVQNKNPNLLVKLQETGRGAGRVNYDLIVTVKPDTPVGEFREQLSLLTDDANSPQIPVMVEGRVESEYTVNPDVVSFGVLIPGEKKTVNVVMRGKKPFKIEKIESEKTSAFEVRMPQEPRLIHVLPLTVTAPAEAGTLDEQFTVTIGGTDVSVQFKAYGKIVPAPAQTSTSTPAAAARISP